MKGCAQRKREVWDETDLEREGENKTNERKRHVHVREAAVLIRSRKLLVLRLPPRPESTLASPVATLVLLHAASECALPGLESFRDFILQLWDIVLVPKH